jgi:predicted 3-demethylubiquinone-9 3-methyltransferase (glyoxalase superfamily)
MQTIVPHLWFDTQAREAAKLYTSIFPDSSVRSSTDLEGTPSGQVEILGISLAGQDFMLMSAGPLFRFTPAVSFMVTSSDRALVDRLWTALHEGGSELMSLGEYPFSPHYAWVQDRFGVSWQLMLRPDWKEGPRITPVLMYTGANAGKAEEAIGFYASIFPGSSIGEPSRYGPGAGPDRPESINHGPFRLAGQPFAAMDSAYDHGFGFNEAISLMVYCDNQAEIDHYWEALSAVPEAEQCGWLKDRYGLSWQIVPREMDALMAEGDPERLARVTKAFLAMKKFDLAELRRAAG